MTKFFMILIIGLLILGQPRPGSAREIAPRGWLEGTVWISTASHERLAIDRPGKSARNNGTDIYIYFLLRAEDTYFIDVHWWNASDKSNVSASAVLTPKGENSFSYSGAFHPPGSDDSDIQGHGMFRIIDNNTAELTLVGQLADGSSSTFVTNLHRVDIKLFTPLAQSSLPAR